MANQMLNRFRLGDQTTPGGVPLKPAGRRSEIRLVHQQLLTAETITAFVESDEVLIADPRGTLTPSQMVDQKLLRLLGYCPGSLQLGNQAVSNREWSGHAPRYGKVQLSPTEEEKTMWNLIVFALIGLVAGTAARMLYPGRQPLRILGTIVLGIIGALVGGMISYVYWPAVDDQFHSGNLLVSLLGAVLVIAFSAGVAYARRLNGYRATSP